MLHLLLYIGPQSTVVSKQKIRNDDFGYLVNSFERAEILNQSPPTMEA